MISFVLPVYNCSKEFSLAIPAFVHYLKARNECFELIVVDDGSKDWLSTKTIAETYGCLFIKNDHNMGKGWSVKKGFSVAKGDIYIFMDGDFPFDLSTVGNIIDSMKNTSSDIVIGNRYLSASVYPNNFPLIRKIGSQMLSFFIGNFFVKGVYDTQCGIKGFKSEVAKFLFKRIRNYSYPFDVEVLFIAKKINYSIIGVPVVIVDYKNSNVKILKDGLSMLGALIVILFHNIFGNYRLNETRNNK